MGSLICSKDHSSLSAKEMETSARRLSANAAFVFFLGPGFDVFAVEELFSIFSTRFTTSTRPIFENRRAISKSDIGNGREGKSHVNKIC